MFFYVEPVPAPCVFRAGPILFHFEGHAPDLFQFADHTSCETLPDSQRHSAEAAMLKLMSSKWCKEICDECIQVLGGNGYSAEFHVERLYRDAKLLEIGEGTSEIQRMVISGSVLG